MAKNESSKINIVKDLMSKFSIDDIKNIDTDLLIKFRENIENIPDYRYAQSYHFLSDIVMITIIATLSGSNGWSSISSFAESKQEWLTSFLELPNGIPSKSTIQRVISSIDSNVFYSLCLQFITNQINKISNIVKNENDDNLDIDIIAVDGKTSKGSKRKDSANGAIKAMHELNVYSTEYSLCLAQKAVNKKTNEIPATQDLIKITNIDNCLLTWDALNTQKDTVKAVIKANGNYVGALKNNHKDLYEDVRLFFETEYQNLKENNYYKTIEKEHSAVITREYFITDDISWLYHKENWKGLKSIGLAKKTIERNNGDAVVENRFFIASIADIKLFSRAVRSHWQVENNLHWHLDYTFSDDKNTTLECNGAENLQIIKKIALAILNIVKPVFKRSLTEIRFMVALNFETMIENIFKCLDADELKKLLKNKDTRSNLE